MSKPRRGVKFDHRRNGLGEGKRSSMSEVNDEGGSPVRTKSISRFADLQEPSTKKREEPTEPSDYEKKKANFMTRTLYTLIMIAGFFAALFMGHIYVFVIMTGVQIVSFKEVIAIASVPSRARQIKATKSLNWYWLATTMYFLYGESVIYYLNNIVLFDQLMLRLALPLATHHRFISFVLYVIGFVFFVATLKPGQLKFQFTNFAWTHMALYFIVIQAHLSMNNVLEGMIWFFLPTALVITNDIWAYICGITFGHTQLIKLSPKKTVEGFVGGWIMTIFFGCVLTNLLIRSKYFICPVNDLGANIFTGLKCDPNPVFLPHTYRLPRLFFLPARADLSFTVAPMQFHGIVIATFASLVAPFGGFFASGLKRTFKIKDFGDSIPGHGGMTDRMDCQFVMGSFAYLYYHSFLVVRHADLAQLLDLALHGLNAEGQIQLVRGLTNYLEYQGILRPGVVECFDGHDASA